MDIIRTEYILSTKFVKHLDGTDLYEMRVSVSTNEYRTILFAVDDDNIIHVSGNVDPIRDIETISIELMLSDLEIVSSRLLRIEKKAVMSKDKEALKYVDVLVDGQYVDALHNPTLEWRGSSNQRVINVPESLKENKTVLRKIAQ